MELQDLGVTEAAVLDNSFGGNNTDSSVSNNTISSASLDISTPLPETPKPLAEASTPSLTATTT